MSVRDTASRFYTAIRDWTYREDWRTWLAHFLLTAIPALVDPVAGAFMCGWYFKREQGQVQNSGGQWFLDNYMDVAAPFAAFAVVWFVR